MKSDNLTILKNKHTELTNSYQIAIGEVAKNLNETTFEALQNGVKNLNDFTNDLMQIVTNERYEIVELKRTVLHLSSEKATFQIPQENTPTEINTYIEPSFMVINDIPFCHVAGHLFNLNQIGAISQITKTIIVQGVILKVDDPKTINTIIQSFKNR